MLHRQWWLSKYMFSKKFCSVISQNKTRKRQTPQNIRCHLFLIILQMFDNNEFYFCNIYILRFGMLRQWSLKKNWLGWTTGSELLWLPRITCTVAPIRPLRFVLPHNYLSNYHYNIWGNDITSYRMFLCFLMKNFTIFQMINFYLKIAYTYTN